MVREIKDIGVEVDEDEEGGGKLVGEGRRDLEG